MHCWVDLVDADQLCIQPIDLLHPMRVHTIIFAFMSTIAISEATEAMPFKKMSEVMQVKKLSEFAVIPTRGSQYAAGKKALIIIRLSYLRSMWGSYYVYSETMIVAFIQVTEWTYNMWKDELCVSSP